MTKQKFFIKSVDRLREVKYDARPALQQQYVRQVREMATKVYGAPSGLDNELEQFLRRFILRPRRRTMVRGQDISYIPTESLRRIKVLNEKLKDVQTPEQFTAILARYVQHKPEYKHFSKAAAIAKGIPKLKIPPIAPRSFFREFGTREDDITYAQARDAIIEYNAEVRATKRIRGVSWQKAQKEVLNAKRQKAERARVQQKHGISLLDYFKQTTGIE